MLGYLVRRHVQPLLERDFWIDLSRKGVDAGLAGCVLVTPFVYGGRHDSGRLVYALLVALAAVSTVVWSVLIGKPIRVPKAPAWLFGLALAMLMLQVTPLPGGLLAWVAPAVNESLPYWHDGPLGEWSTISLTPRETLEGAALLLAHGLLYVVAITRVKSCADAGRLLGWVAASSLLMTVVALAYLAAPELRWLEGLPRHAEAATLRGAFTNKNHLAHYLLLSGLSLGWVLCSRRPTGPPAINPGRPLTLDSKRVVWAVGLLCFGATVLTLLATASRGGAMALAAAATTGGALAWRAGWIDARRLLPPALATLALLCGASLLDQGRATDRLGDLVSGDVERLDTASARRMIWQANARALLVSPLLGHGAGSHQEVYPLYLERPFYREYSHAESGYLQIASETGLAGLLLLGGVISWCVWLLERGYRSADTDDRRLLWIVLACGLVASLVHSLVDFVWFAPSLISVVILYMACATSLVDVRSDGPQRTASKHRRRVRPLRPVGTLRAGAIAAACCACLTIMWGPALGWSDWRHYRHVSKSIRTMETRLFTESTDQRDPHLAATIESSIERSIELLRAVVRNDPHNARAHARLSARLLQSFQLRNAKSPNPMSVEMIRSAVQSAGFESREAMLAWLDRAFGEQVLLLEESARHAVTALRLCPLQGDAYLRLAGLAFLAPRPLEIDPLVQQAVLVRPKDGRVLFEAGRQEQLAGNAERAIDLYRRSAAMPGAHRTRLVASMARVLPAAVFVQEIRPDYAVFQMAMESYRVTGTTEDLEALVAYLDRQNERPDPDEPAVNVALRWRQASSLHRVLGRHDRAVASAERAHGLAPHNFWVRLELAAALREAERFDEADPHIRWCLARRPDIRYLRDWLHDAAKRKTLVDRRRRERMRLSDATTGVTPPLAPHQSVQR